MTNLVHGRLAGQDITKLTASSVLLVQRYGGNPPVIVTHYEADPATHGVVWGLAHDGLHWSAAPGSFTYIGERGPDGVISAPVGGWTGNPVPGRWVRVWFYDDETVQGPSDDLKWVWECDGRGGDIVAFSLIEDAKAETLCAYCQMGAPDLCRCHYAKAEGEGAAVELTKASEVIDLLRSRSDPFVKALNRAQMDDADRIELAYAVIADRKDRASPQVPAVAGEPDGWRTKGPRGGWLTMWGDIKPLNWSVAEPIYLSRPTPTADQSGVIRALEQAKRDFVKISNGLAHGHFARQDAETGARKVEKALAAHAASTGEGK